MSLRDLANLLKKTEIEGGRERETGREGDKDERKKTARNGEFRVRGKKVYRFSAESASDCRKIWKIIATSRYVSEIVGVAKRRTRMQLPHAARQMWV